MKTILDNAIRFIRIIKSIKAHKKPNGQLITDNNSL